jgi:oligosaccharide translocation protein RFT1
MTLLAASVKGTTYLIALQASSRVLTFALNQLLLRYTNPSIFGFATIQLELLLTTILFLCREGFRITIQRLPAPGGPNKHAEDRTQEVINISWIPVTLGLFLATIISTSFMYNASQESLQIPYFRTAVRLYAISTIVELLAEPGYNVALYKLQFRTRAICEGSAVIIRCITSFGVSLFGGPMIGALPFAYGQLTYSITLLLTYWYFTAGVVSWRLKTTMKNGHRQWLDAGALSLSVANTIQGLVKHVLTEGDKMMISYFCSNEEQGKYSLTGNYGGLIARIVLQPIEEATRSYFSNLLPQDTKVGSVVSSYGHEKTSQARLVLSSMLHMYLLLSCIVVAIGPPIITTVTPLFLSDNWLSITPVLAWYMYYIPLLAINGILEAFVTATATPTLLRQQSLAWVLFSGIFCTVGYLSRHNGATGLVIANCTNLGLRIYWASRHILRVLKADDLKNWFSQVVPSALSLSTMVGLATILRSMSADKGFLLYVSKVSGVGLVAIFLVAAGEYTWMIAQYEQLVRLS